MSNKRKRKKVNKTTKAYQRRELRILKNKCLRLWSERVRELAGNKCSVCGSNKQVHAHHIEDGRLNPALRYSIRNGVALCPKHHKFGAESFHKSFIFAYKYMNEFRKEDLQYLLQEREKKIDLNWEYLITKIEELRR